MSAQRDLEGKIKTYFGKGWQVDLEKDSTSAYNWGCIVGPTGNIYDFRKLQFNDCTICCEEDERNTFTDADGDEAFLCAHSEKDLAEQEEARAFYKLVDAYKRQYGTALFEQPKR
jgi:hypothetical protein